MSRLKLEDLTILRRGVFVIATMASKAIIQIGAQGLLLTSSSDPRMGVVLRVPVSKFSEFSWNLETTLAEIDVKELDAVLDTASRGPVSITTDTRGGRFLTFVFDSHQGDSIPPFYGKILRSMKLDEEAAIGVPMLDDLNFQSVSSVRIAPTNFINVIKELASYGKTVHVNLTSTQVMFSAGNLNLVIQRGEVCNIQLLDDIRVLLSFGLQHLQSFLNAAIVSDNVSIRIPVLPMSPCMLHFSLEVGEVKFLFPPKMKIESIG